MVSSVLDAEVFSRKQPTTILVDGVVYASQGPLGGFVFFVWGVVPPLHRILNKFRSAPTLTPNPTARMDCFASPCHWSSLLQLGLP